MDYHQQAECNIHEVVGVMIYPIHCEVLYHPTPMFEVQSDMKN